MFRYKKKVSAIGYCRSLGDFIISEGFTGLILVKDGEEVFSFKQGSSYVSVLSLDSNLLRFSAYPIFFTINILNNEIIEKFEIPDYYGLNLTVSNKFVLSKRINNDLKDVQLLDREKNSIIWNLHDQDILRIYSIDDQLFFTGWINKNFFASMELNSGKLVWKKYFSSDVISNQLVMRFKYSILIQTATSGVFALHIVTGDTLWNKNINVSAFDEINGVIYVLTQDYLVLDVLTGEEQIKVENWLENQVLQYPALANIQSLPYLSEEYLVFSSRTREDKIEGGVFFIDKNTAEVKEYFRIVFDKDPVRRRDWDGNKIPDDEQIPFMPLETPIYKDGRLYVVLPSPVEGQKDLYVYEREE